MAREILVFILVFIIFLIIAVPMVFTIYRHAKKRKYDLSFWLNIIGIIIMIALVFGSIWRDYLCC